MGISKSSSTTDWIGNRQIGIDDKHTPVNGHAFCVVNFCVVIGIVELSPPDNLCIGRLGRIRATLNSPAKNLSCNATNGHRQNVISITKVADSVVLYRVRSKPWNVYTGGIIDVIVIGVQCDRNTVSVDIDPKRELQITSRSLDVFEVAIGNCFIDVRTWLDGQVRKVSTQ